MVVVVVIDDDDDDDANNSLHRVSRKPLPCEEKVAMHNLQLTDVMVRVFVDVKAQHVVAPAARAWVAHKAFFCADGSDFRTLGKGHDHLRNMLQVLARDHASDNVKDAGGVTWTRRVQLDLFHDARDLFESRWNAQLNVRLDTFRKPSYLTPRRRPM